jgi:hypothetical protein
LTEGDLERKILCNGRVVSVAHLFATAYVGHAVHAFLPRVGEGELVQLAYVTRVGSMLFTWPFCDTDARLPRRDRLRATSQDRRPWRLPRAEPS